MRRLRVSLISLLFAAQLAWSQLHEIDSPKLPLDPVVQQTVVKLADMDQYSRTYEAKWRFAVSQAKVKSALTEAVTTLRLAQQRDSANRELQLLTALVGRLAYNLDVQSAYEPSIALLKPLIIDPGTDDRPEWFLGMLLCQSNNTAGGMRLMLGAEQRSLQHSSDFWQDYAICAQTANMPVHAVRAFDLAHTSTAGLPIDTALEQIARNRITPSSLQGKYPSKDAWIGEVDGDRVHAISSVCGEGLVIGKEAHVQLNDVENGSCVIKVEGSYFPTRHGKSSASYLFLTQAAKNNETLDAYTHRILSGAKYKNLKPATGVFCPVSSCLAFEIVSDGLYPEEGGAHLIALLFASEPPQYPGLRFEKPQSLPTSGSQNSLFESYIELSEKFFSAITSSPIPLDLRALRALRKSPLSLDLYSLICHKTYSARKDDDTKTIPWEGLHRQMGAEYKELRNFKQKVIATVRKIRLVYPQMKVDLSEIGMHIHPAPLAIPERAQADTSGCEVMNLGNKRTKSTKVIRELSVDSALKR